MFENIGKKIKGLATFICIAGIFISVALGLVICNTNTLTGILVWIIGCLASWIGSFFMYGYGELIDKTTDMSENINRLCRNSKSDNERINEIDRLRDLGLISEEEHKQVSLNVMADNNKESKK